MKKYTREEVFKNTLEYFDGDELATKVWIDKYALKDREGNIYELTPKDMHKRLSKEFSRIETNYKNPLSEEEIFHLFDKFKYLVPAGSPMEGIGNNFKIQSLSNCFVIGDKEDSYASILKIDEEQVHLMRRRGGVGSDMSYIRPNGAYTTCAALTSTGIVPFAERYSNSTRETAQNGRRGARMISLDISHPDAEEFIDAKLKSNKITGANISIRITDEFMGAVKNNKDFIQRFPIDSDISNLFACDYDYNILTKVNVIGNNPVKYIKKIKAKDLWNKITHNAWKSAEPGILFIDQIRRESPSDCYGSEWKTESCNPCVTGDTLILTDKGYYPIIDLIDENINVWNGKGFAKTIPKITGKDCEILKITLSDGRSLKCTPYHTWYTWEGFSREGTQIKKEAKYLNVGDKIEKYNFPIVKYGKEISEKEAYTQGFYSGDGTKGNKTMWLYGIKIELSKYLDGKLSGKEHLTQNNCKKHGFRLKKYQKDKSFTPINNYSIKSKLDWLAGLIDSDGTSCVEGGLQITSIDHNFLKDVQYLLSTLGVNSKVCKADKEELKELPDGKGGSKFYNCKETKRILVSAYAMQDLLKMGLNTHRVDFSLFTPNRDASRFVTIESIEKQSQLEDFVYCFNELEEHKGVFNGILTGQCGEIPLNPYSSCILFAINLYSYVINPFTNKSLFNWELFKYHSKIAQKLIDDIVDLEIEKIDQILEKVKSDPESEETKRIEINLWKKIKTKIVEGRRTGLGITAEGDMLAALGLRYGTKEATDFAVEVHKTLAVESYKSSIQLAEERGSFQIWNREKEKDNPFLNRVFLEVEKEKNWIDIETDYFRYGRRNIANLTIAPTGCQAPNTQVITDKGILSIGEICGDYSEIDKQKWVDIKKMNVYQEYNKQEATKGFINGVCDTKKILLKSGLDLESTLNHKYKVINFKTEEYLWKQSNELKRGDCLVYSIGNYTKKTNEKLKNIFDVHYNTNKFDLPSEITIDLAYFLGNYYADGSTHTKGIRIHYNKKQNNRLRKQLENIISVFRGCDDIVSVLEEKTTNTIYFSSKLLLLFLNENGLLKNKSINNEIPLLIRKSSKEVIKSFIEGYKLGDGSKTNNTCYIDTVSKKMAQQLCICYRAIGINSYIKIDKKRIGAKSKKPMYRVYEKGFGSLNFNKFRYIQNSEINKKNICDKYGNNLFFDEIVDISDSKNMTLDIEVPINNKYLANTYVSHNTTSLMTQTTSGIEPVFKPYYIRRRKVNDKSKAVFTDEVGDMWEENKIFHHKFVDWFNINKEKYWDLLPSDKLEDIDVNSDGFNEILEQSPYYKATSSDVDYIGKVEMQGKIQKWIDHSISVTVNMPEDVTEQIVSDVYKKAYEVGCKGITVYREGSRSGVLISDSKKETQESEGIVYNKAPKRSKTLNCDIYSMSRGGQAFTIIVGLLKEKPYEIFALEKLSNCEFPDRIKKGTLTKVKSKTYELKGGINEKEYRINNIIDHLSNEERKDTRKFSSMLRHGMHPKYMIEQINEYASISSFDKVIAKALSNYLAGEKIKTKDVCPSCGGELRNEGGCNICPDCGWSACS